jgi:hypothetical protein
MHDPINFQFVLVLGPEVLDISVCMILPNHEMGFDFSWVI